MIGSRKMRWAEHVAHFREIYTISADKSVEMRPLGERKCKGRILLKRIRNNV
jgi:hypothetical protein